MADIVRPKYPDIEVELTSGDGNALFIIGTVHKALRRGGVPEEEVTEFTNEATSGDYDHVLRTCMRWVDVT